MKSSGFFPSLHSALAIVLAFCLTACGSSESVTTGGTVPTGEPTVASSQPTSRVTSKLPTTPATPTDPTVPITQTDPPITVTQPSVSDPATSSKAPTVTTAPTTTQPTPTSTSKKETSKTPITSKTPTTSQTQAPKPETPPTDGRLILAENGRSDYVLIYPAAAIRPTVDVYTGLQSAVRQTAGCTLAMKKDSESAQGEYEILIGQTDRPASRQAYEKLGENQFSFTLSEKSVVIAASDDACMKLAIETFMQAFADNGKLAIPPDELPVTYACGVNYRTVTINNTANVGGDDPYVVKHDGYYYYCWSDNGVKVARIENLNQITKANGKQVFNRHSGGFENVWAPELHYINGEWYIYVAMCKGTTDNAAHRMYCLKGTSQDPTDPFELVGKVTDPTDKWAIDGTIFQYKGELYTVWSGWMGNVDGCQNLYIAHMSNPWTIDSERVLLSMPMPFFGWDGITTSPRVNEGPCAIVVGDTVHILFSGNGSWTDDYCIGTLTFSGGNILSQDSWKKSSAPILSKSDRNYGPGHCSVVQADDGSYQMIYHGNLVSGSGWGGRSVRVQQIEVTPESVRVLGSPLQSELKIAEKYVIGRVSG